MKLRNEGQALVEFFLTLALTFTVVFIGLQFVYFAWAKLWIRHVLFEAAICEMSAGRSCKLEAENLIKRFLPLGRLSHYSIRRPPFAVHGNIRFDINEKLWVEEGTTLTYRGKIGGFVFISFLIPLAFTIFVGLGLMALILNERAKQFQICWDRLLGANEKIEDGIQKILFLNKPIFALQVERDALEAAKKADPDPYSLAAIEALIQANEGEQQLMTFEQQSLRNAALAQGRAEMAKLRDEATGVGGYKYQHSSPNLILQPEITWQTAKQQSRPPGFSDLHKIRASWRVSLKVFKNIFKFPEGFVGKLKIDCASTIREEGNMWLSQLSR